MILHEGAVCLLVLIATRSELLNNYRFLPLWVSLMFMSVHLAVLASAVYGSIRLKQIMDILAYLRIFGGHTGKANRTTKNATIFSFCV
jgi:hypothetical protein